MLYVRPLDKKPEDPHSPWYSAAPLGKHTLQQKVKKMCAAAGIQGTKTNHSLRATGATELYKKGVPEKLIQERTGHRSIESLRTYERTSEEQHKAASTLLSAPSHSSASYSHCFVSSKTKTIGIHSAPGPGPSNSHGLMPVSFQNLQGCTINITTAPQPPPQAPLVDFTETELENFFSDYPGDYM